MRTVSRTKRLLLAAIAMAFVSVACVGFSDPRGWAAPVFESGNVYVFLDAERLVAVRLDEFGGEALWSFPDDDIEAEKEIELDAVYGPPLFAGDRIILAAFSGEVVALSREGRYAPAQGSWRRDDVRGSIVGGAVLAGGRLIFGTTAEHLYVRSAGDGGDSPPWPRDGRRLKGEIWAQPVVLGGALFAATTDGNLYAFDLETGEELWDEPFDAGGAVVDLSAIDEGLLFVPTLHKRVWLVDIASGRPVRAAFRAEGWVWTSPAVADGVAYFGDFGGVVHALDLATGRELWSYDAEEKVKAQSVIIGNTLIVGDEGGSVHFVDLATGARRNVVKLDGAGKFRAGVVAVDGYAWVLGTEGRLYRADPETLTVVEREVRGLP